MTSMPRMPSTNVRRNRIPTSWLVVVALAATMAAVGVSSLRPEEVRGAAALLAAEDLASRSGTECVAIWNPMYELPQDIDARIRKLDQPTWIQEPWLFGGSIDDFTKFADGIRFMDGANRAFVNGSKAGELVTMVMVRAPATEEAWIVASTRRPIPCE